MKEFVELLNSAKIDYLIVGAHAMAFYGVPRYTGDLDILVRASEDTAPKLVSVLNQFGFSPGQFSNADFLEPKRVTQIGVAPNRIDLLTTIDGVAFDDAWEAAVPGHLDGIPTKFISKRHLIDNKRAVGRSQDIADIQRLEK
ncbi:MAG: hypothetical protein AAB353_09805 [Candidatus Hydrogenedentota bacterium]